MTDAATDPNQAETPEQRMIRLMPEFTLLGLVQESLIQDLLTAFASVDPEAVGGLRDQAMRAYHRIQDGDAPDDISFPIEAFWRERAASLERAMRAVGNPYRPATVTDLATHRAAS